MRLFSQKFDYVFSIGEDCACASYLNWHRLRVESSPFDWLTRASFATRTGLLENGFAEFLQCENMRQIPKPTEGYRDEKCDYYADDATDFYFYHDFPAGIALNASFPAVKEKYQRRISRLLGRLASSGRVLMVWWSRDKRLSDAELLDALDRLQRRYPNVRLSLLAFEQSDNVRMVDHVASNVIRVIDRICPDVNVTWGIVVFATDIFVAFGRLTRLGGKRRVSRCFMLWHGHWRSSTSRRLGAETLASDGLRGSESGRRPMWNDGWNT